MSASTDALLAKTDAELRFFVDNPQFYQPELVSAARRELTRRAAASPAPPAASPTAQAQAATAGAVGSGASPAALPPPVAPEYGAPAPFAPPAPDFAADYLGEPARRRPWLVPLLVLLAAVAAGVGIYSWSSANQEAAKALAVREAARLSPDSLKLETAASTPLPSFDVDQDVARQLAVVPAGELKQVSSQEMRQYRIVSTRFWQAQHPTEFLVGLATSGKAPSYALLTDQIRLVEGLWHNSGNALVYSYKFPPTMADQVSRMRAVAAIERRVLEHIRDQVAQNAPASLSDKDQAEHATARELLAGMQQRPHAIEAHL